MKRALLAIGFVVLTWYFGGPLAAVAGSGLALLRLRGATPRFYWQLAVAALVVAPMSVLVQGLPSRVATPAFGARHWVAHALVGVALASAAFAAFLELPRVRAAHAAADPPAEPETGDRNR
jgi:hypothetical protein